MDAKVNDFFNEINEIVPTNKSATTCAWQECIDKSTGYPYYWNVDTNAVTWEMPEELSAWLKRSSTNELPIENEAAQVKPLFPSATAIENVSKAIYRVSTNSKSIGYIQNNCEQTTNLTAYDNNSDSDNESGPTTPSKNSPQLSSKANSQENSDNDVPEDVKSTLGFKLLANYGDDSEENSTDDESETIVEKNKETHSTLFPSTEPIDISQFSEPAESPPVDNNTVQEIEELDAKAFKRKKRIGVQLINHKRPKTDVPNENSKDSTEETKEKPKFVAFVKSDVLNANEGKPEKSKEFTEDETDSSGKDAEITKVVENSEDDRKMLLEKLTFLCEGRESPTSVQILLIQLEALYTALNNGGLSDEYFTTWLLDVSNQIVKLEEETAPEGWSLQWDRKQKRYYYRNHGSGECQWEYPQEEDDAMDICTTPPPDEEQQQQQKQHQQESGSPTRHPEENCVNNSDDSSSNNAEVTNDMKSVLDSFYSDIAAIETANSNLSADDAKGRSESPDVVVQNSPRESNATAAADVAIAEPIAVAKRKKKVKVSHLKKKGVSQLVEKWKNAQKDLD